MVKEEALTAEVNRLKEQVSGLLWTKDYIEIWQLMSICSSSAMQSLSSKRFSAIAAGAA